MDLFVPGLFFIYGLCFGSFLNVVIYRLPIGMPIAKGRSLCPRCGHTLSAADLVPLFSFLFLRGRCRYCAAPISWRYPGVEALTGLAFGCCGAMYGLTLYAALLCAYCCALILAWFIDLDHTYIPDRVHLIIVGLAVLSLFTGPRLFWGERLAGLGPALFMLLLSFVTGGGIGGGDIKLMAASGLLLGWRLTLPAFFLAYLLAALRYLPAYLAKKIPPGFEVPMAPCLALALMAMALFGPQLLGLYWNLALGL